MRGFDRPLSSAFSSGPGKAFSSLTNELYMFRIQSESWIGTPQNIDFPGPARRWRSEGVGVKEEMNHRYGILSGDGLKKALPIFENCLKGTLFKPESN